VVASLVRIRALASTRVSEDAALEESALAKRLPIYQFSFLVNEFHVQSIQ